MLGREGYPQFLGCPMETPVKTLGRWIERSANKLHPALFRNQMAANCPV